MWPLPAELRDFGLAGTESGVAGALLQWAKAKGGRMAPANNSNAAIIQPINLNIAICSQIHIIDIEHLASRHDNIIVLREA